MSFDKIFESYIDQYTKHKELEIKLDLIKQGIRNHYEGQDERLLKVNGVVARTKTKKEYQLKEEIYDFLEDYGYLPLVVKINSSIEKHFNLEQAKINQKQSLRLYSGGRSLVDKEAIIYKYEHYLNYDLQELSTEFKRVITQEKLEKTKLENIKEQLKSVMPSKSISTEFGTLKITDSFDYDLDVVFDSVSGKKEIFIRKSEEQDQYEVVIYPDEQTFKLSGETEVGTINGTNEILNENNELEVKHIKIPVTVEDLYVTSGTQFSSQFITKRPFNKFIKEGFVFNKFEVDIDPFEFFRKCEISKTKINELVQQGIIEEKDIQPFLELIGESDYIEVLSEASAEQQASIFQEKLMEKAQNYRARKTGVEVVHNPIITNNPTIDITDFKF